MNITLYAAAADVRELLEQIDPDTGELPSGYEQARAVVAAKARNVIAFVLETEAHAHMVGVHAETLLERARIARKRMKHLRQYLAHHMAETGITNIAAVDGTFLAKLYRDRDESVDVFEAALLPADYLREIPATSEPDKVLLKKAMRDGFEVPGARLIKKDRLVLT